uniref:AlNc14C78G5178 protein n=1 Tax=Albugo laibachii Nc14 TaxID=890382 RepID=F0WEY0_9STRA|nr:AlNc14C78G5178 [Albugo laibachii Nc14]|eukprot:CCA19762.1 AlNc14C78G5178 [Albugo laibachii Nc14]
MDDNLRTLQDMVRSDQTSSSSSKEDEAAQTSEQNFPIIIGSLAAVLVILAAILFVFWIKCKRDASEIKESNSKQKDVATKMTTTPHEVIPTLSASTTSYRNATEKKKWNGQKSTASMTQETQSVVAYLHSDVAMTPATNFGHTQRVEDAKNVPATAKPSWIGEFTSHRPSNVSPRISSVSPASATPNFLGATQIAMAAAINAGVRVGGEEFKLDLDHGADDQDSSDDDDEYFCDRPGSNASDRFSSLKLDSNLMSDRDSSVYHQSASFCSDVFSVRSSATNDDADIYEGSLSFSVTEGRPSTRLSTEF